MKVTVKQVGGHVEIYDLSGEFLFSADTMQEAAADLRGLLYNPGGFQSEEEASSCSCRISAA